MATVTLLGINICFHHNNKRNILTAVIIFLEQYDSRANDMDKIAVSIALSQEIIEGMKALNLIQTIGKFSSFFGGIGAIFSIIGGVFDSIEVQKLDKLLTVVNKGFLKMESKLEDIVADVDNVKHTVQQEHFWTKLLLSSKNYIR